jgi:hypothetical protein
LAVLERLIMTLLGVAGFYLAIGLVVALYLLIRGLSRLDPAAMGATRGFRVLVFPGLVALWPLLLRKWLRSGGVSG